MPNASALFGGGAKPKIKRKTVNIPNFELKKGDQVFLGVDSQGNTRLVPWDVHSRPFAGTRVDFSRVDPSNLTNNRIVPNAMDAYATFGEQGTEQSSGFSGWPTVNQTFTHHIPGTDAIFVFGADDSNTGDYGTLAVAASVLNLVSTETLEYEVDNISIYSATTDADSGQGFYMGDDASYWYYLLTWSHSTSTLFRACIARVNKSNFGIGKSSDTTLTLNSDAKYSIFRIDTSANRVYLHQPHRGDFYHYFDYDLTALTLTAVTTTTSAATVESWGAPLWEQGSAASTAHHTFFADPDDFTKTYCFIDTEQAGYNEYGANQTFYQLYELIHDGTKWAVSLINEIDNQFSFYQTTFKGAIGLGGGYFMAQFEAMTEFAFKLFHIDSTTKQLSFPYDRDTHEFSNYAIDKLVEDDWIDTGSKNRGPKGNYINGTYYSLGEAIIDGKVRPGFDIRYLLSVSPPTSSPTSLYYQYGAADPLMTRVTAYVLKEDADFVYGVLVGARNAGTGALYLTKSAFRIVRGCPQISSNPIARAASNSVKGAFGMNVLRFSANPSDGDTVTIGSVTYTFKTALTPTAGEVLIGADSERSAENLQRAINQRTGEGTSWATGTTLNTEVCVVDDSEKATLNGERYVYLRTLYTTDDVISCSETGANMAFDHATMQNGAPGGDVVLDIYEGVEYAEGTPDTYQAYDNETYEIKYLNGHFDMSHCEIAGWNTHSINIPGVTGPDSTDISFKEYNGPVVVENLQIVSSGTLQNFDNGYVKGRGRRLSYAPFNGTAQTGQALFKVGILK